MIQRVNGYKHKDPSLRSLTQLDGSNMGNPLSPKNPSANGSVHAVTRAEESSFRSKFGPATLHPSL